MFTLISGLPGSGKSLHTIKLVEKERVRPDGSKRAVYYWGIPDLKLDWIPLHSEASTPEQARSRYDQGLAHALPEDAFGWFNVPPESIVVIDECQYIFPKLTQKQAAAPPEHYKQLAIHRHSGTDLYCMTQHPSLIAVEARRQVQRHWHLERPFGLNYTNRLAWERAMSPDDRAARAQAAVEKMTLDPAMFGLYRSAQVHNVQKRLPWKKIAVLGLAIVGAIAFGVSAFFRVTDDGSKSDTVSDNQPGQIMGPAPLTSNRYSVESLQPRLVAWPWSAPIYDSAVEFRSVPRITGCMSMRIGNVHQCTCHDGQGVADVPLDVCRAYMAGRYFDPTRPVVDAKADNIRRLEASQQNVAGSGEASTSGAHVREPSSG